MSVSAHALVHVGEPHDTYYCDTKNAMKQSIPVDYNTRYSQDFTNKGAGTSVITISPNAGIRHVVVTLGYDAGTLSSVAGYALERGWGYNAIEQVSFRIGGSSQYFLSGAQLLARNMRLVRTKEQKNSILSLGGTEVTPGSEAAPLAQYAYIPISVWAAPGEDGLGLPLSSDLLAQQIQITITLKPSTAFWINSPGGTQVPPPTQFNTAYAQIEQLEFKDRGMALSNRVDMDTHMYAFPLPTFDQQEFVFTSSVAGSLSGPGVKALTLSGFRSGEVKKIQVWCVRTANSADATFVPNPLLWEKPQAIEVLYMGLKYATYQNGSSAIWNLLDGTSPSAVDQSKIILGSAGTFAQSKGELSQWVELPFAQPTGADYESLVMTHGKEILNGIANLNIVLPDTATTSQYEVHVVYVYNASVGFSKSTAELIF